MKLAAAILVRSKDATACSFSMVVPVNKNMTWEPSPDGYTSLHERMINNACYINPWQENFHHLAIISIMVRLVDDCCLSFLRVPKRFLKQQEQDMMVQIIHHVPCPSQGCILTGSLAAAPFAALDHALCICLFLTIKQIDFCTYIHYRKQSTITHDRVAELVLPLSI